MDKENTEGKSRAKKILLVEDEFITASNIKSNLLKLGYEVVDIVDTGEDAIEKAAELHPDLILMDIMLVGPMSGIEAAAKIKETLDIPLIYLTAHADTETIAKAKITEPFGYLPKPCNEVTMMSAIEMALYKSNVDKEREKLVVQLQQSQKMESIGVLAGGVAHYLNNMLAVIMGYADLIQEDLDPSDKHFSDIQKIIGAGKRSADIVEQLLAFARKQSIAPKNLDLNELIEGKLQTLKLLTGGNVELLWNPADTLAVVRIDQTQVEQILEKLVDNARTAIQHNGTITIRTRKAELDLTDCETHAGFVPGTYQLLSVSDNGCGMDKETQSHIFEPFFTSKPLGETTGLGLAVVYGIIRQNNGFIDVTSEVGMGTTFNIFLPCIPPDTVDDD